MIILLVRLIFQSMISDDFAILIYDNRLGAADGADGQGYAAIGTGPCWHPAAGHKSLNEN